MEHFIESNYSIQDLEQFRDENGFINLSSAGIQITEESREKAGNPDRVKNWINFAGKKALIKGEIVLEEEQNYGIYAELIVEEMARQMGVQTARYDLIKIKDAEGNIIIGVLSESVIDLENEDLVMLHSIIGDQPENKEGFEDITDYEFTVEKLREELLKDGYKEEDVDRLILDYKKRMIFTLSILDADKHTENVAFVKSKGTGGIVDLSANYDSEASLMLDTDISTIKKLLEDSAAVRETVTRIDPKIGLVLSIEEGGLGSIWMDTLEKLCEDDEVYDYYNEIISTPIDMDLVFENVEEKIRVSLPEDVKTIAKYAYKCRNEEMEKVMSGEIEMPEQERTSGSGLMSMVNALIRTSAGAEQIRAGELVTARSDIEKGIKESPDIVIEDMDFEEEDR